MTNSLTIGERVAWYRRRRGVPQEVLAGRVGRTTDWLSKVENNRIDLDRLSVIRNLADALDVSVGDLIGEPTLLDWNQESGTKTVPALRAALMDYRQLTPLLAMPSTGAEPVDLDELRREVGVVFDAYQASKYGFVAGRAPLLLADAVQAAQAHGAEAQGLLALSYQAATSMLTKLGETDLAWIAAERGLSAAQQTGDPVVLGSLFRSVVHALLSTGRYAPAVQLTETAAGLLQPELSHADSAMLSIYGSLFLAGSMAAARTDDRGRTQDFLREAQDAADRLGADANHVWTAFGPTNVKIHRVATAMELGDVQVAVDLGPAVDTSGLPVERQVRHSLETARALSAWNRTDAALSIVLEAERHAPEQVQHHYLSRQLVLTWMRQQRTKPGHALAGLAQRLRLE
ncbi:transcriptional regulator with XRE-family HTH domain [Saccharothrix ecbatanensis]|uniref:Transcriptional regulator with XRE-family HTH domain n=2 Tax=Saccharothrix ecbatanensis TaxID=1105145 RepID=A0A7W9HVW5_9PSEU|nr:transcriptional regulator with XRE-family HTH domain [Saccharothrix ecbatanensis]